MKNMQMQLRCDSCGQSWVLITIMKLNKKKVREFSYNKLIMDRVIFGGSDSIETEKNEENESGWKFD